MKRQIINQTYLWLLSILALFFLILAVRDLRSDHNQALVSSTEKNWEKLNSFANLELQAQAALVYDPDRQHALFAKNTDIALPTASISKLMTVLVGKRLIPPTSPVAFNRKNWPLHQLLDYTLVTSSNQAAVAVATAAEAITGNSLLAEMNQLAQELGLGATEFKNVTGLDLSVNDSGTTSSAQDIARLIAYILKNYPDLLEATRFKEIEVAVLDGTRYIFPNTNTIIDKLPGLLASKTGFTDLAQGNLVIVFDRGLNQPIIIVVLGSSEAGRFADVQKLLDATITAYL